jgi:hypothetical protein
MSSCSAYIALFADTLEEAIKPDLRQVHDIEKKNWFHRNYTPEHAAYDPVELSYCSSPAQMSSCPVDCIFERKSPPDDE